MSTPSEPSGPAAIEAMLQASRARSAERIRGLWRTSKLTNLAGATGRGHTTEATNDVDVFACVEAAVTFCVDHIFTDAGGADLGQLIDHVTSTALLMTDDNDRGTTVARMVVDWLLGEDQGRTHRRARYANPAKGYIFESLDVPLLRRQQSRVDDDLVITTDTTLINMLYVALDNSLADATVAHDAVIRAQLSQGRFSAAQETAKQNAAVASAFAKQLTGQLDLTKRNVAAADWSHGIPALIETARQHIHDRLADEEELIQISENLMVEQAEKGETDSHAALVAVVEQIRAYRGIHLHLFTEVIGAQAVFLDAQAYQGFGVVVEPAIDFTGAFHQALLMGAGELADAVDAVRHQVQTPVAPPVVTVGDALHRLLAAPRVAGERIDADPRDLVEEPERHIFSANDITAALHRLSELDSPTNLSSLLDPADPKAADLLVMLTLAEWATPTIDVGIVADGNFVGPTHHGTDLTITPGTDTDV